ncbi:hypothetical protein [Flavobacterium sp. ASV13]|uniref:hypothetical protein n=1 Tax=Flavobacterium sp. ASV13 TaxID=1506583 RepID=UPI000555E474|nr:hypothetical protein [Flavobacterium sp. ASV13]
MKTVFVSEGKPVDPLTMAESAKVMSNAFGRLSDGFSGTTEYSRELHEQLKRLATKKSHFERFYDSVSNFLSKGKSFLPKELKSY